MLAALQTRCMTPMHPDVPVPSTITVWRGDGVAEPNASTKALVRAATHTVLDVTWLLAADAAAQAAAARGEAATAPVPTPTQVRAADPETRAALAEVQDPFGDSYTDDTDAGTLAKVSAACWVCDCLGQRLRGMRRPQKDAWPSAAQGRALAKLRPHEWARSPHLTALTMLFGVLNAAVVC